MSHIHVVPKDEATGDLKRIYADLIANSGGRLPPVLQLLSLHPQALERLTALNQAVTFGGSTLGRRREEMLATAVSAWNDCHY